MTSLKIIKNLVLAFLAMCLVSTSAHAAGWEFAEEEAGIKSFRKSEPGNPVTAFKGVAVINAPLAKVAWVIRDNRYRTEWVDRLKKSQVLQTNSPFDKVIYQHFGLPWPIADRDYVYRARVYWNDDTLVFNLRSTKNKRAPKTVGVRARLNRCYYYLKPLDENRTHITVEVHTDPMGSLPSWLVNLIQASWPIKTLKGIRNMVGKSYAEMSDLPLRVGEKSEAEKLAEAKAAEEASKAQTAKEASPATAESEPADKPAEAPKPAPEKSDAPPPADVSPSAAETDKN